MADTRVADLTDSGVPADADLLYLVDVSVGPPRDRKLTVANLKGALRDAIPQAGLRSYERYLYGITNDNVPTEILVDGFSQIFLPSDSTTLFSARIAARSLGGGLESAVYKIEGSAINEAGVATLHSGLFKVAFEEDDEDWDVTIQVSAPGALRVIVTGGSSAVVQWLCVVQLIEVSE